MKVHIYLEAGVLKMTTEAVPNFPRIKTSISIMEYNLKISAIKERSTLVGNKDEAYKFMWEGDDRINEPISVVSNVRELEKLRKKNHRTIIGLKR